MRYRPLGRTGLEVSQFGFGAWGIGGQSYGAIDPAVAVRALEVAEECGCNFVDTAGVYGASEEILGRFLAGRRSRWLVATKYSGQPGGLKATLAAQLARLGVDYVDLYQIHWVPRRAQSTLYDELAAVKRDGLARFVGVSAYSDADVDDAIARTELDCIQLPCSLIEPEPYRSEADRLGRRGLGVVVRSVFHQGFLTGKFAAEQRFADPQDQRRELPATETSRLVSIAGRIAAVIAPERPIAEAAALYPFAYGATSTVILGTKTPEQARFNFGHVPDARPLAPDELSRLAAAQLELGLGRPGLLHAARRAARRAVRLLRLR